MSETIHFEYLGCEWYVNYEAERDTDVTPGSVTFVEIEGYAAGTLLPSDLVGHLYDDVLKRAIDEAARG